ncbi:MAG: DNA helicase RecQ [Armatimonadetes bacterium]|nr:DNA helicase RecQ [Armatimonadota bacterium]
MRERILEVLRRYWGYDSFLPLQEHAMACVMRGTESVVVLPTGGGKSLCYQAPAVTLPGMALVVSPLISLMKDQVDSLVECGVPAARLDSSLSAEEQGAVRSRVRARELKLLYVSPERLMTDGFLDLLRGAAPSFIAVDEAHCVSMWGHDFRPEYRQLGALKEALPGVCLHAYTATATQQVRDDIARQLRLTEARMLVGLFDRPNLAYKVERRANVLEQVRAALDRHRGDSGIVYCIRRADVDNLCQRLDELGYRVRPYHAGLDDATRKRNQEAFIREEVETIVATVAFGMGIDKSNVRYVIHAGMPKSPEHYQQESGRAGRDGLEAECTLFYSAGDFTTWSRLLSEMEPEAKAVAQAKLADMYNYCTGVTCRHQALVRYFGQELAAARGARAAEGCGACDVCLGDLDCLDESLETAQGVLLCVTELEQRFGADYTAQVLLGSRDQRVVDNGHTSLPSYGLLAAHTRRLVRDWLEQLVAQGYLYKTEDYHVLRLTEKAQQVLAGEETPRLLKPAAGASRAERTGKPKTSKTAKESWDGVDAGLFEALRALRRDLAADKGVPAYVVFGDAALRDMARLKPTTATAFLLVHGVGEKKRQQYGDVFLAAIRNYATTAAGGHR